MIDNGRSEIFGTKYADALACIRCGACQNACPVYRSTGGHAYGWVYGGPIGAVLTPLFVGLENATPLPHASSLCGSCKQVCPVDIDLPRMLLDLRWDQVRAGQSKVGWDAAMKMWAIGMTSPTRYALGGKAARAGQAIMGEYMPGGIGQLEQTPRFPRLCAQAFPPVVEGTQACPPVERILSRLRAAPAPFSDVAPIAERRQMIPPQKTASERLSQFIDNARSLGCFVYQVDRSEAVEQIMDLLDGDNSLLSWDEAHLPLDGAHGHARIRSVWLSLGRMTAASRVGLTGVNAALAATGSLVLESGPGRFRSASLLPDLHIALMTAEQILPDLETWAAARAHAAFREASNTVIVSGPSKTADIGHQLVKGAHGPRELHILILTQA